MNRILAKAAIGAFLSLIGNAAIVVDTANFGPSSVPFGASVSLNQFSLDPSRLLKVTLEFTATLAADIAVENNSANWVTTTAMIVGSVNASAPSGLNLSVSIGPLVGGPRSLAPSESPIGAGADFTTFGGPLVGTQTAQYSTVNPLDFAPYLGGGTFDVIVGADGGWSITGNANASANVSNFNALGTVKVIYEYSAPEPHQLTVLAGLGLVGFAAWRRFKNLGGVGS